MPTRSVLENLWLVATHSIIMQMRVPTTINWTVNVNTKHNDKMFGRSKLRQILSSYKQDMLKDKVEILEINKINNHDKKSEFNKFDNNDRNKVRVPTPILNTAQIFNNNNTDFKMVKTNSHVRGGREGDGVAAETDFENMDIFHRAASPILIIGQCFAMMPVMGVHRHNPRHLRFSFKSVQMIVLLVFLGTSSILTFSMMKHLAKIGVNAKNCVGFIFFGCVQFTCMLFLTLAPRWPALVSYWTKTELIFTRKPYERPKRNLAKRLHLAAAVIIFGSIIEHGLFLSSNVFSYRSRIHACGPLLNTTLIPSFEDYMLGNYDYVFELLPYYTFIGISILIVNSACTFVWNYMDLFVVMVSMGLAYRFEQITNRINKLVDKEVPESVFIEIREHYVKVCELLEHIDESLSGIILLSCMNNLYFVCYQLLNIFNKLRWSINYIYFWFSLLYLIGRTAYVFLTAASINDQSKGSLSVLRRLSVKTWCVEVERLIFQMTTQTVALSGKKFYFLTRRLLFGMAGTIVTYELVLLQFDEPNRSQGLPDLCA